MRRPVKAFKALKATHCHKHPDQILVPSKRTFQGKTIRRCPICIETARAKLAPLLHLPHAVRVRKQHLLPPVRMPWY